MSEVMTILNLTASSNNNKTVARSNKDSKSDEFASVYKESVSLSDSKETSIERVNESDVRQIAKKESKKTSNDVVIVEDGKVELEQKLVSFLEDVKQKASDMNVDVLSILQVLLNYSGTKDINLLTDLLMESTNAQSHTELVLNPNLTELMSDLKQLTSQLENILKSLSDKNSFTTSDIEMISTSLEKFIQSGLKPESIDVEALSDKLSSKNAVDNPNIKSDDVVISIDLHKENQASTYTNSELSKDNKQAMTKKETIEKSNDNNLFINRLNTIDVIKGKIDNINQASQSKSLESLLKQDIVQQIVNRIQVNTIDNQTSMTIQLKPEHLGNLILTVSSTKGNITAQFMAENANVKEAIEMNLFQLKTTLEQQGINVDEIEVTLVNDQYFEQRKGQGNEFQDNNNKRKALNVDRVNVDDELIKDEEVDILNIDNNRVIDYSA